MVDEHGSARVAVALGYRSERSIGNWLSTKSIPRARRVMVEKLIKNGVV